MELNAPAFAACGAASASAWIQPCNYILGISKLSLHEASSSLSACVLYAVLLFRDLPILLPPNIVSRSPNPAVSSAKRRVPSLVSDEALGLSWTSFRVHVAPLLRYILLNDPDGE